MLDPSLQFIPTDIVQKNLISSKMSSLRLPFNELMFGIAVLSGLQIPSKAKYRWETNSEQVQYTRDIPTSPYENQVGLYIASGLQVSIPFTTTSKLGKPFDSCTTEHIVRYFCSADRGIPLQTDICAMMA